MHTGCLEPHQWKELDKGIQTLDDESLFIHDSLGLPLDELIETTRKCIKEKDISIIFIDCLQMIDIGNENGSPSERTANVMRSLKQLAIQENLPIIVGTMLNKFSGYDDDYDLRRPELTNLPDPCYIEELADVVMFVHYKQETGAVIMRNETSASTYKPTRMEDLKENKAVRNLIKKFDLEEFSYLSE